MTQSRSLTRTPHGGGHGSEIIVTSHGMTPVTDDDYNPGPGPCPMMMMCMIMILAAASRGRLSGPQAMAQCSESGSS
jgi:hypothetical protein